MEHTLPTEIKYEILKNKPYYRRINKTLHQDKKTHQERFCTQPISYIEFYQFIKYRTDFGYIFTPKTNGFYVIRMMGMGFDKVKIFDFTMLNHKLSVTISEITNEDFNPDIYMTPDSYYDIFSSLLILSQRDCPQDNIKNKILIDMRRFSKDLPSTDIHSYMYNVEKYIYYHVASGYNLTKDFAKDFTNHVFGNLRSFYNINHFDITYEKLLNALEDILFAGQL